LRFFPHILGQERETVCLVETLISGSEPNKHLQTDRASQLSLLQRGG